MPDEQPHATSSGRTSAQSPDSPQARTRAISGAGVVAAGAAARPTSAKAPARGAASTPSGAYGNNTSGSGAAKWRRPDSGTSPIASRTTTVAIVVANSTGTTASRTRTPVTISTTNSTAAIGAL